MAAHLYCVVCDDPKSEVFRSGLVFGLCEGVLEPDYLQELGKVLRFRVPTPEARFDIRQARCRPGV